VIVSEAFFCKGSRAGYDTTQAARLPLQRERRVQVTFSDGLSGSSRLAKAFAMKNSLLLRTQALCIDPGAREDACATFNY